MKKKIMMILSPALALVLSPWTIKSEQRDAKAASLHEGAQREATGQDIAQSEAVFDQLLTNADIENGFVSDQYAAMRHDR